MSDESPNVTCSQKGEGDARTRSDTASLAKESNCTKLCLDDHIKAYIDKKKIDRQIESIKCSSDLIDKVILNYIIVKQILSNLCWQDKLLCKQVCTTWHSALQALKREQLGPIDFMVKLGSHSLTSAILQRSNDFHSEPMVVMTFVNGSALDITCKCKFIDPTPCGTPCQNDHCLLDVVYKYTSAPKDCMNTVHSGYISYMPLAQSSTYQHTVLNFKMNPYVVGIFIPVIPDVKCHKINIKSIEHMEQEFCNVVLDISKERIFKGIFVYVADKYLLQSVEDIIFLNHFKDVQPDIPYALGGCIVEDTIFEESDINGVIEGINEFRNFFSENLISLIMFTVPKSPQSNEYNFDMFSLILDSSVWSKAEIQQNINDFSKRVPQFEHSVVVKLSCVGRDQKHKWEQDCFRAVFPNTRLLGCYGNGELGIAHPAKPPEPSPPLSAKRRCRDPSPQFGIIYSYSTVFVYMGWGKILSNGPS